MKGKVLIVEDQFIEANNLQIILEKAGYTVCGIARSVPLALRIIEKEAPELVLLDIFLKGSQTGIDLAWTLKERKIAFVYLSANSDKTTLETAKATRPYGFLVKPFREKDVLVMLEIANYLHTHHAESVIKNASDTQKAPALKTSLSAEEPFRKIIGKSRSLLDVLDHLKIVAAVDTSVLILGESGTGKEKVAQAVHELSPRKNFPFIKVNCATLPPTLIESILFGHEKGAFTGATEKRVGKFEQANKGTLFLDEIGELPVDVQSKLLRFLQEKEIERLGSNEVMQVDVRIIAATNRNLENEVAQHRFRMDLYYRLNVFPVTLPPLRDRKEDIPLLAQYFLELFSSRTGRSGMQLSDNVMNSLLNHSWPGNIRELEHSIERAVLLAKDNIIRQVYLSEQTAPVTENRVKTMEENERDHIIAVLKKCNGKIFGKGGAAEILGMNTSTLNSRMKKLGIERTSLFG